MTPGTTNVPVRPVTIPEIPPKAALSIGSQFLGITICGVAELNPAYAAVTKPSRAAKAGEADPARMLAPSQVQTKATRMNFQVRRTISSKLPPVMA